MMLAVELRRRVEVVVVGGEPGRRERVGLLLRSACRACSTPPCPGRARRAPSRARGRTARRRARRATRRPCRSASRPARARCVAASVSSSRLTRSVRVDVGLVVRRLRTVGAVLRTAAGLDAEQHAALHFVGAVMRAMDASARGRRDRAAAPCRWPRFRRPTSRDGVVGRALIHGHSRLTGRCRQGA